MGRDDARQNRFRQSRKGDGAASVVGKLQATPLQRASVVKQSATLYCYTALKVK
jgi:hypothetical protein